VLLKHNIPKKHRHLQQMKRCNDPMQLSVHSIVIITFVFYLSGCASTEKQTPDPSDITEQSLVEEEHQKVIESQQQRIEELEKLLATKEAQIKQKHIREKEQEQVIQAASHEITRTQIKLHRLATKSSSASLISEAEVSMAVIRQKALEPSDESLMEQSQQLLDTASFYFSQDDYASATHYASQASELINMIANTNRDQANRATVAFSTHITLQTTADANLRHAPGRNSAVRTVLKKGTVLIASAYQGNWLRVQTDQNQQGWVSNTLIEIPTRK